MELERRTCRSTHLCDFNGIDFEADLKEMYSVVHRSMACRFPSEFGPEKVTEPSICVKDMSSEEYNLYKKTSEGEKVQITKAYDRIKSKVKGIRRKQGNEEWEWKDSERTF